MDLLEPVSDACSTPLIKSATKVRGLLREYRRGLTDEVWLAAREGKLEVLSDALASTIAAIQSRGPLYDMVEGSNIPELDALARELDKVLQGGRRGRGSASGNSDSNARSDLQSEPSQAHDCGKGCASGGCQSSQTGSNTNSTPTGDCNKPCSSGDKKSSGCGGCSGGGCGKSAPPDVKQLLLECTTQEQRWALRDRLIEYEINSLMARNPSLVMIPESRKKEIRKQVETALEVASESIHRDMMTPGGGRAANFAGTLVVGESGSLTISSTGNFSDSD